MKRNIPLLYGFSFFDQFMIVIALWVPYLTTQGISMRQFMELQAIFAIVILSGEVPTGLLSDLWGRKNGIALSLISGGDIALLYDSHLAAGGEKSSGTPLLGNAKLAAQLGTTVSALLGGAIVTLSYGYLLWANAILSWIPVLLVLRVSEPPAAHPRTKKWSRDFKDVLATTLVHDGVTRLIFLNLVVWGSGSLVMFWVNQKYWQASGVPLVGFGVLLAAHNLVDGFAARSAAFGVTRYGRRPLLAAVGLLPIIEYFGMASFLGWGGILFGFLFKVGRGVGEVLFLGSVNERISAFCLLGPLVDYGIDAWGLPSVLLTTREASP